MATKKKEVVEEVSAVAEGFVRGVFASDNKTVHVAINETAYEYPANVEVEVPVQVAELIGGFTAI